MESDATHYDKTDRSGPKIFVGEWATREGSPTPTMNAALGDAAWMTGLERNSDLVIMASYAPLFVNVSSTARGPNSSMQWPTDLIGYDALTSYGSPSYYAQKIFNLYRGDVVLPITAENIPTQSWQPPAARARAGQPPPAPPAPRQVPTLFYSATRDTKSGTLYIKLVNTVGTPQPVHVDITGLVTVSPDGQTITLSSAKPTDTNSITNPEKIVPVIQQDPTMGMNFLRTLPPYSITILQIQGT
jgi:alpha-N-arabinofuranosidase